MYNEVLNSTEHREFPMPDGPWVMTQRWDYLLFMHLPVSESMLAPYIPKGLELDTFDGDAWISILPFKINNMHFRMVPPIPFINSFLELNVRTYVKQNGLKGVYFFSLDANKLPAVLGARVVTLPYFYANMKLKKQKDTIFFESKRNASPNAFFKGSYKPISEGYYPEPYTLSHWLVERYCLWSERNGSLYRGDIHHKPWELQDVEVIIDKEEMLPKLPDEIVTGSPIFHYSHSLRVLFWTIKKVE